MDIHYNTHREILDTNPTDFEFDFPFLIHTNIAPHNIGSRLLELHPDADVVSFVIQVAHYSEPQIYSVRRKV